MSDTICAISTALGVGAISIIRVSGNDAIEIVNKLFKGKDLSKVKSHTINYGHIVNNDEIIDNCFHDKKKEGNSIRFILLKSIGNCYSTTDVTREEMNAAIDYLKGELR